MWDGRAQGIRREERKERLHAGEGIGRSAGTGAMCEGYHVGRHPFAEPNPLQYINDLFAELCHSVETFEIKFANGASLLLWRRRLHQFSEFGPVMRICGWWGRQAVRSVTPGQFTRCSRLWACLPAVPIRKSARGPSPDVIIPSFLPELNDLDPDLGRDAATVESTLRLALLLVNSLILPGSLFEAYIAVLKPGPAHS